MRTNTTSRQCKFLLVALCITGLSLTTSLADIGYQFVYVGNPGNANDPATGRLYGGVSYAYSIGKYDVTLSQYTTFLNAVAATSDPYGLYNSNLATDLNVAGIQETLASGTYTYSVIGDGQRPVTYVSWFDAARFCNWLQNGQPTGIGEAAGSTEQGAYTLNGATSGIILKNTGAQVYIPSESEWYKAAFYDPNLSGTGGYWSFATRSNSAPGNVVGGAANQANYYTGVYSVTQSSSYSSSQNYLTDVGAFTNSASAYGTYDQNGDVIQWNDAVISSSRRLRGGCWAFGDSTTLQSYVRYEDDPANESSAYGFRVATVPEPSTWAMLAAGSAPLLALRRRKRE